MWDPGLTAHVWLLQVRGNGHHRDPVDSLVACNVFLLKKKKFLKHRKAIQEKRKTKSLWLKQCTVCVCVVVGGCGFFVLKTCRGKGDKRLWPQPLWPLCSEHLSGEDGEGQGQRGPGGGRPCRGAASRNPLVWLPGSLPLCASPRPFLLS